MRRAPLFVVAICLSIGCVAAGTAVGDDIARHRPVDSVVAHPSPAPTSLVALTPGPSPSSPNSFASLGDTVSRLFADSGADGAVSLIELSSGRSWALNGNASFVAASTYKLPLLMMDAQDIAFGKASPNDELCYDPSDWEDGYFGDYEDGACYKRAELDRRAGIYSDNTAAHILVRYDGGAAALNAYARAHGATDSAFYDPNTTTSNDLASLWQAEARGRAGGGAAQAYLYPLLTHTLYEDGIPSGERPATTVVHKVGFLDGVLSDAALVKGRPRGAYVLAVCTDGGSWELIAQVASPVSQFEAS